ncbi:class I SAM-dependent methyltransferase [Tautonia sp. JC769]|uniref:class I SAM-dependent methyltransferase n=1 Tax=Tautonia sp. JC769 TaxID=3232135 RepID=UPI00345B2143
MSGLPRIVELARLLVARTLSGGDFAIDATVGNGHDTLWLARQVGSTGRVLGLDVQSVALRAARRRLAEAGVTDRVLLVRAGHERIDHVLARDGSTTRPKVVMFNLGYLPGGDHFIATRPESTIVAIEATLARVVPGGLVTVVAYPGHAVGQSESNALREWIVSLSRDRLNLLRCDLPNTMQPAPWLLAFSPESGFRNRFSGDQT